MTTKGTYIGLFLISLASLMFEILLTRIFSVTQWYHFAFLAVSIALFGMTVGSLLVYLLPGIFIYQNVHLHMALSSVFFGILAVLGILTHLSVPFAFSRSIVGTYSTALTYFVISLPFVFSGICVCLALTRFPGHISKLYAADLVGAALGCILLLYLLRFTDGPTMVFVIATLACCASIAFAWNSGSQRLLKNSVVAAMVFGCIALVQVILVGQQRPLIRIIWSKGRFEPQALYEKWNSFSRVRVWDDQSNPALSKSQNTNLDLSGDAQVELLNMDIDSDAYTAIFAFNGDLSSLEFLKFDVANIAHYLRPNSRVLVIGAGGGRDVLAALAFNQKSVVAVEINENILDIVNNKFGDYSGHLDRNPKVKFVIDEARSYIARSPDEYDIIQASMIDTWAATSAGAYVLSENSLYTLEAWENFLNHLTPDGILTFSRWYDEENPIQMYRLTALATVALQNAGIRDPRSHILIAGMPNFINEEGDVLKKGTLLISKKAFTSQQVKYFEDIVAQYKFDLMLSPHYSVKPNFATIADGKDLNEFIENFPLNIAPPTDDIPFFFQVLRVSDVFRLKPIGDATPGAADVGVYILGMLLITVTCLTGLCILVPLTLTKKKVSLQGSAPLFVYFTGIGLGYMLVEISQMQRLIIFLGHPSYSLSVVLFSLLVSSGLGSFTTSRMHIGRSQKEAVIRWVFLVGILILFGLFTPAITRALASATTPIRIFVAVLILLPLGFVMGMAFPIGMKFAAARSEAITPWLWGINGAASVLASVLAVAIALSWGFSIAFWIGFTCYGAAFVALNVNMAMSIRQHKMI